MSLEVFLAFPCSIWKSFNSLSIISYSNVWLNSLGGIQPWTIGFWEDIDDCFNYFTSYGSVQVFNFFLYPFSYFINFQKSIHFFPDCLIWRQLIAHKILYNCLHLFGVGCDPPLSFIILFVWILYLFLDKSYKSFLNLMNYSYAEASLP